MIVKLAQNVHINVGCECAYIRVKKFTSAIEKLKWLKAQCQPKSYFAQFPNVTSVLGEHQRTGFVLERVS